jgi:hypothetical protein
MIDELIGISLPLSRCGHPLLCQFVHEKEIQAEDDQVFLLKLQVRLDTW